MIKKFNMNKKNIVQQNKAAVLYKQDNNSHENI